MSTSVSGFRRPIHDHFEPDDSADPHAQRKLRGHLEQIDYTAFASNREVLSQMLGPTDAARFQRLAVAAAHARATWVAAALAVSQNGQAPSREQVMKLTELRHTFEELTEAYDALRRMVERGYLSYQGPAAG